MVPVDQACKKSVVDIQSGSHSPAGEDPTTHRELFLGEEGSAHSTWRAREADAGWGRRGVDQVYNPLSSMLKDGQLFRQLYTWRSESSPRR